MLVRRLGVAVAVFLAALASSAAQEIAAARHGQRLEFKTDDGWTLVGEYWPGEPDKLTFLLVHGASGKRREWEPLRRSLFAHGYGVLEYDSRGYGDSTAGPAGPTTFRTFKKEGQDNDWNQMSLDLDAASRQLQSMGVALSSMAVAGAAVGANIGLKWAAVHREIALTVLLSPGINHHDVLSVGAMRAYGPRPVLIVAGEDDRPLVLAGKVLYDNARYHSGESYATFWIEPKGQGTAMLTPEFVHRVVEWISMPVKAPEASTAAVQGSTPTIDAPAPLLPLDAPH